MVEKPTQKKQYVPAEISFIEIRLHDVILTSPEEYKDLVIDEGDWGSWDGFDGLE